MPAFRPAATFPLAGAGAARAAVVLAARLVAMLVLRPALVPALVAFLSLGARPGRGIVLAVVLVLRVPRGGALAGHVPGARLLALLVARADGALVLRAG